MLSLFALLDTKYWIEKNSFWHPNYVYLIRNFAYNHCFMNIHKDMIINLFFQFLKKMVGVTPILQFLKTII